MENPAITIRRWPGGPQDVILQKGMIVHAYLGRGLEGFWPFRKRVVHYWKEVTFIRSVTFGDDCKLEARTSGGFQHPEELFLYRTEPPSEIAKLYEQLTIEHWDQRLREHQKESEAGDE